MEILFVIVVAYLIVYRTGVGTWCAITGKQTPWERARERRQAQAGNRPVNSNRTARGFLGRLYGDLWEDLHRWRDESTARRRNGQYNGNRPSLLGRLRGWFGDLNDAARGWLNRADVEDEDGDPGPVGVSMRPPEMPTMETVSTPEPESSWERAQAEVEHAGNVVDAVASQPEPAAAEIDPVGAATITTDPEPPRPALDPNPAGLLDRFNALMSIPTTNDDRDGFYVMGEFVPFGTELADTTAAVPEAASNSGAALASVHQLPINRTTEGAPQMSTNAATETPEMDEAASVQSIDDFGHQVVEFGNVKWQETLEAARINIHNAGLSGDPKIETAVGTIEEAAAQMATAGEELLAAMVKHVDLAAMVSETEDHGALIGAYENQ